MGKHQLRLLRFAIRFRGWHNYGYDKPTVRALASLERLGLIEIDRVTRQFILAKQEGKTHDSSDPG